MSQRQAVKLRDSYTLWVPILAPISKGKGVSIEEALVGLGVEQRAHQAEQFRVVVLYSIWL